MIFWYILYLFLSVSVTMYHKLCILKKQKFIVSQFWILKVWNQSVGSAMYPPKPVGENLSLPLLSFWWFPGNLWCSLTWRCITHHLSLRGFLPVCVSAHRLLSVNVCGCVHIFHFSKGTSWMWIWRHLAAVALQSLPLSSHDMFLLHVSVSVSLLFLWGH